MQSRSSYKNSELLKAKEAQLDELSSDFNSIITKSTLVTSYSFHGFVLNFHGSDSGFVKHITSFLPSTWKSASQLGVDSVLDLYLCNDWDLNWDLEENPDCLLFNGEKVESAIQRDFIGIDKGKKVLLNLDAKQSDGIFNALRWLLPRRMIEKGYFLLHSSCVVQEGKAHFFLGHSGAGKSTVAKLSGDRIVLGDDMNVMRIKNGKVYARAGGLGGLSFESTNFDEEFPVEGFYWLSQSDEDEKLPLNASIAVTKFLASLANVFWENLEDAQKEKLMSLGLEVATVSPFYELKFTKTEECWNNVI